MKIDLIAGARPNFMKVAPIHMALLQANEQGAGFEPRIVHTGQHYDKTLSGSFFEALELPQPVVNFGAGGGSHAEQTARIMIAYEQWLERDRPDLCIVVGDVNSTLACAISAKKAGVVLAHVEGGLRSGDRSMPEEINRIATDSLSDHFFTTSVHANRNLQKTGVDASRIHFVGNTMIDTLVRQLPRLREPTIWSRAGLQEGGYFVLTLHRPANVDNPEQLQSILRDVVAAAGDQPVLFPVHPRTVDILKETGFSAPTMELLPPLPYLEFNFLVRSAQAVLTDSGGITEETTFMGVPCITLRATTERPETVELGTNVLAGKDGGRIRSLMQVVQKGEWPKGSIPPLWEGKASERIVARLREGLSAMNPT